MTQVHDITRPPSDSAAEAKLLCWAIESPLHVEALRLCGFHKLLHGFWEHRALWEAIGRTAAGHEWPIYPGDAFAIALLGELCRSECTGAHTFEQPDDWPDRCRAPSFLGLLQPYWVDVKGMRHPRLWADDRSPPAVLMQRLRNCREARRLIDLAQQIAERAWLVDLEGAVRIASQARLATIPPPVWERNAE